MRVTTFTILLSTEKYENSYKKHKLLRGKWKHF